VVRHAGRAARLAALLTLAWPLAASAASIEQRTVVSRGKKRTYAFYAPESVKPDARAPLLVVIHGSTGSGRQIMENWTAMADKHGILLAGPDATDNSRWASPQDGPLFLKDVVDEVATRYTIDGRRMYLFGHSAGANFALQMAILESEFFAAAAIHAGAVSSDYFSIFDFATRKIPLAIYIGDRDQFYPIEVVRAVNTALEKRGFTVLYREIKGHDHAYKLVAPEINEEIWKFFSEHPLPQDPRYTSYRDP
jgi:poly(3-hydroxybutyrate) depolymerase